MWSLTIILAIVSLANANEWSTSRNQYCIERCTIKEKLGKQAYVCYTVDGYNKEFRPSNRTTGSSGRPSFNGPIPSLDNDDYPWDYCAPAKLEFSATNNNTNSLTPDNNQQQGGFNSGGSRQDGNQGGSGFNPGASAVDTSLPNVKCNGPCKPNEYNAYTCSYEGSFDKFYCSPDLPLERNQISSHNKLWCMTQCDRESTGDYMCKTLLGKDHCSKARSFSSSGTMCIDPCGVYTESGNSHLTCRISESTYEQCGSWDVDVQKTKALEYTRDGKVCASPCTDNNGEMLCSFAQWKKEGTKDDPKSVLYMMEGECGPDQGMNWTLIGIILGSVVGAIILIALVGVVVSKRSGYNRAATSGN